MHNVVRVYICVYEYKVPFRNVVGFKLWGCRKLKRVNTEQSVRAYAYARYAAVAPLLLH